MLIIFLSPLYFLALLCISIHYTTENIDTRRKIKFYNKKYGVPVPYINLLIFLICSTYPIIIASIPFYLLFKVIKSLVVNFKDFKKSIILIIKDKIND